MHNKYMLSLLIKFSVLNFEKKNLPSWQVQASLFKIDGYPQLGHSKLLQTSLLTITLQFSQFGDIAKLAPIKKRNTKISVCCIELSDPAMRLKKNYLWIIIKERWGFE
jgi:hypothetical protein